MSTDHSVYTFVWMSAANSNHSIYAIRNPFLLGTVSDERVDPLFIATKDSDVFFFLVRRKSMVGCPRKPSSYIYIPHPHVGSDLSPWDMTARMSPRKVMTCATVADRALVPLGGLSAENFARIAYVLGISRLSSFYYKLFRRISKRLLMFPCAGGGSVPRSQVFPVSWFLYIGFGP